MKKVYIFGVFDLLSPFPMNQWQTKIRMLTLSE